jgi:hypothetical protein
VPLYRALAFGTVNFGGNGGAINGIDCPGNVVRLPLAQVKVPSTPTAQR